MFPQALLASQEICAAADHVANANYGTLDHALSKAARAVLEAYAVEPSTFKPVLVELLLEPPSPVAVERCCVAAAASLRSCTPMAAEEVFYLLLAHDIAPSLYKTLQFAYQNGGIGREALYTVFLAAARAVVLDSPAKKSSIFSRVADALVALLASTPECFEHIVLSLALDISRWLKVIASEANRETVISVLEAVLESAVTNGTAALAVRVASCKNALPLAGSVARALDVLASSDTAIRKMRNDYMKHLDGLISAAPRQGAAARQQGAYVVVQICKTALSSDERSFEAALFEAVAAWGGPGAVGGLLNTVPDRKHTAVALSDLVRRGTDFRSCGVALSYEIAAASSIWAYDLCHGTAETVETSAKSLAHVLSGVHVANGIVFEFSDAARGLAIAIRAAAHKCEMAPAGDVHSQRALGALDECFAALLRMGGATTRNAVFDVERAMASNRTDAIASLRLLQRSMISLDCKACDDVFECVIEVLEAAGYPDVAVWVHHALRFVSWLPWRRSEHSQTKTRALVRWLAVSSSAVASEIHAQHARERCSIDPVLWASFAQSTAASPL